MLFPLRILVLILSGVLITACSGTKTSSSWKQSGYNKHIKNVYIIGIAKNKYRRTYFEKAFYNELNRESGKEITLKAKKYSLSKGELHLAAKLKLLMGGHK